MYWGFSEKNGIKSIAKIVKKNKELLPDFKELKKQSGSEKVIDLVQSDNKDELKQEVIIDDDDLELEPLMVLHDGSCPNRVYLAGNSFCGKSTMAAKLAQDWNMVFPKSKVAYISYNENDKACNDKKIDNFLQIKIDENILKDPLELDEFHDKLIIFDDCDAFCDPKVIKELEKFVTKCINTGRHKMIGTIVCRQKLLAGWKSSDTSSWLEVLRYFKWNTPIDNISTFRF